MLYSIARCAPHMGTYSLLELYIHGVKCWQRVEEMRDTVYRQRARCIVGALQLTIHGIAYNVPCFHAPMTKLNDGGGECQGVERPCGKPCIIMYFMVIIK